MSIKFAACEYAFPIWGRLAMRMAKDAGFTGIRITDGGGYLQPHPKNNGFVEYERFGLDLRRKDSYPILNKEVQENYLESAEETGMEITDIYLYLLNHQGFIKNTSKSPQGQQCLETIKSAVVAANQMKIKQVTIPVYGTFGIAQNTFALQKLEYAAELGDYYGVTIAAAMDYKAAKQLEILEKLDGKVKVEINTIDPVFYALDEPADFIKSFNKDQIADFAIRDMYKTTESFVIKEESKDALLGEGDAKVKESIEAIKSLGYDGTVVSETHYYSQDLAKEGEDFVSLAKKDLEMLKAAFGA